MIVVVAATEIEMSPFLARMGESRECLTCVVGVGVLEAAVRLTTFMHQIEVSRIDGVVNFGVGGGYAAHRRLENGELLDLCLAEREIFADFGICFQDHYEPLPSGLPVKSVFSLDQQLLRRGREILAREECKVHRGDFLTVSGASGTRKRGHQLFQQYGALCENMEGAAVAKVCEAFSLPLLELRSLSNWVEDRDVSRWKLKEACARAALAASLIVKGFINEQ